MYTPFEPRQTSSVACPTVLSLGPLGSLPELLGVGSTLQYVVGITGIAGPGSRHRSLWNAGFWVAVILDCGKQYWTVGRSPRELSDCVWLRWRVGETRPQVAKAETPLPGRIGLVSVA